MATSRFTRVAAVIAVTPLLQQITDALRQGRRLSGISSRDGRDDHRRIRCSMAPPMTTAMPWPAARRRAGACLDPRASARSAAASFLDEVGVTEAAQSLADPERQVATSGQ